MQSNHLSASTNFALMQAAENNVTQHAKATHADMERINKVAEDFEAVFISEMIKPMFDGVDTENSMFGGGKGEEIFHGMMLDEYGKSIAKQDITGIQTQVRNKLIEMQSERTAANETQAIQTGTILDLDITKEE